MKWILKKLFNLFFEVVEEVVDETGDVVEVVEEASDYVEETIYDLMTYIREEVFGLPAKNPVVETVKTWSADDVIKVGDWAKSNIHMPKILTMKRNSTCGKVLMFAGDCTIVAGVLGLIASVVFDK